jgi:hypothetical protein
METNPRGTEMSKGHRWIHMVALCVVGLLINYLLAKVPLALNLPLFLDNVGSALAAALGGYIPGIVVGFFTNIINGIGAHETTYYGSLTVLIAICSAWFAERGYYGKLSKLPIVVITYALIGGGLGSVLTWTLYGFEFGTSLSAPLAQRLLDGGALSPFWAQFVADMLIDLLDKAITVAIVAVVLKALPQSLKDKLYFAGWQQTPLTRKKLMDVDHKRARRMSLRSKIILLVAAAMVIIAVFLISVIF